MMLLCSAIALPVTFASTISAQARECFSGEEQHWRDVAARSRFPENQAYFTQRAEYCEAQTRKSTQAAGWVLGGLLVLVGVGYAMQDSVSPTGSGEPAHSGNPDQTLNFVGVEFTLPEVYVIKFNEDTTAIGMEYAMGGHALFAEHHVQTGGDARDAEFTRVRAGYRLSW